jgi:hypothetical protein
MPLLTPDCEPAIHVSLSNELFADLVAALSAADAESAG